MGAEVRVSATDGDEVTLYPVIAEPLLAPAVYGIEMVVEPELVTVTDVGAAGEEYGITSEEWDRIRVEPGFQQELQKAVDMLKEEGMTFRIKAKLQAEELLKSSWRLIHDPGTPPNVRADLIKATMRWALYDVTSAQGAQAVPGSGFNINIQFANPPREPRLVNP